MLTRSLMFLVLTERPKESESEKITTTKDNMRRLLMADAFLRAIGNHTEKISHFVPAQKCYNKDKKENRMWKTTSGSFH